MKIAGIVEKEFATLLKMAGVIIYSIEEFDKIIKDKEISILIISENFASMIREKIFMHRLQGNTPFIVEIPGKEKIGEDSLKRIIIRAVGLEV